MNNISKQSGFTLVEVIIVISIMGIIGGLSSQIIGRSLEAYAALERRNKLQTSIRLAVERMSRELRHALPHSICVSNGDKCAAGASIIGNQFYFIPVRDSGRYQDSTGLYTAPPPIQRESLPVTPQSQDRFDVLSTNAANRLTVSTNDWIAVYNINNSDIYTGINDVRKQISAITQKDIHNDSDNSTDIDQIQFAGDQTFAKHSPSRRFHIIDNTRQVTLFYLNGTNLYRDTTTFSTPHTKTANTRLLMENISALSFNYTPGSQYRAGFLHIDITVSIQGEQIQVIHDAHVYNTP